jgi:hypothetical protein
VQGAKDLVQARRPPSTEAVSVGNPVHMTDEIAPEGTPEDDARFEVVQAVVDRIVSWQEGAEEGTVRSELDAALAAAGVDLDEAAKERIVERVADETPHFDVREVLDVGGRSTSG